MIVEMICYPFILLAHGVIALLPVLTYIPNSVVSTINLLMKAMQFFPTDVWFMTIGNILFWVSVHLIVGLIKFILGFIPTMDGG